MNLFRGLAVVVMVGALGSVARGQVPFEDTFDGPTLGSAWTQLGTGSYTVNGDLEFTTEQGDFHPVYEPIYGTPNHAFLMEPNAAAWTAVTRVRYNTPDQDYEQVNLLAYGENGSYVKVCYESGKYLNTYFQGQYASQTGGYGQIGEKIVDPMTDYFWLRLDREGDRYATFFSADTTTDPNSVVWTYLDQISLSLGDDPMGGIAGWNTNGFASGELAEFDYYRVGALIPEPATLLLLVGGGAVGLLRRRSAVAGGA